MPYKDANNEAVVTVVSETSKDLISHKSVDDSKQAWKETAVICPGPKDLIMQSSLKHLHDLMPI